MQTISMDIDGIDGWLHRDEARLLFRLARDCKGRGAIVEIGSWKGKSTICLARGSIAGSKTKVHAIDPHTGSPQHAEMFKGPIWTFEEFKQNVENAGVKDVIEPHVDFSDAVAKTFDEPVELIFIDGLHEYEGVKSDFDAWFPKVVDGGHMAFHDSTCWPGVLTVVTDCLFKSRRFRKVRFAASIVHGEKVAENTVLERMGNRVMLWVFRFHAWKDRSLWRLLHHYLDFPITRSAIAFIKRKRRSKPLLPSSSPQ